MPCCRDKLAPLPVPESHFDMWTMDFVTGLPLDDGFNGLMVCIEKLTKLTHLIPCFVGKGALTVPKLLKLFFAHMQYISLVFHTRLSMIGTLIL